MKKNHEIPKWSKEFRVFCAREGLTMKDVAEKAGIGVTTVSHYRTGKKLPRMNTCAKLKKGIGFDMYKALYESYLEEQENEDGQQSEI